MQPELIADYACLCGEGPLWNPDEKRLYWLDIPKGRMFRYDPATGHHEECFQGEQVGGITLQADGSLLMFGEKGSVRVWKDGQIVRTLVESIPGEEGTRFNDVIADPAGRVFCGTMPSKEHLGSLYRLDTNGKVTQVLSEITCSNGMGYTADQKQMYFTDSMKHEIYVFDYDKATGAMTNQRVLIKTPEDEGIPDGMTVDAEGTIWSARWDGGCLVRFSAQGQEMQRIPFPAKKVSCVTFAGDDYTDMYITTAGGWDKATEGAGAGALFRINLGIKGMPEFRSRVGL
jgi:D-xylono/L-arabinono-1,4-lactonase